MSVEALEATETWEIQIPGSIRIWVMDRRHGGYVTKAVNGRRGKGPRRITLTKDERLYNQELVPQENRRFDPFLNGSLVQIVDGKKQGDLTDEAIGAYLELESESAFSEAINDIRGELTHRRLLTLAAHKGRMWQVEMLRELIEDRYPVPAAGSQPVVDQMYAEGEFGATRLS